MSIGGYHIREAGATAAQEIGFALANAIAYVQAAIDAGLDVDAFAGRLSWIFQTHNHLFEEVAKLRAARRLWAKVMRQRFGAKDPRSWMFRTHVQTSGSTLVAQQPMTNIIRATVQSLAAVLGGVQSLATSSWDEAMALPSEESVQLSLRTQQIIAYESGVADSVDPMGGSYLVESLTNAVEEEAKAYIETIDGLGGAVAAIEQGFQQREIHESAYRYQLDIESGRHIVVGVNKFISPYPKIGGLIRVDPAVAQRQKERLASIKERRDKSLVSAALRRLEEVARGSDNVMPTLIDCVEVYATLGEMCDVLRGVFGEQREFIPF
jgi:methylmalonyl-CoA mutase N-terminal domain/subunit